MAGGYSDILIRCYISLMEVASSSPFLLYFPHSCGAVIVGRVSFYFQLQDSCSFLSGM